MRTPSPRVVLGALILAATAGTASAQSTDVRYLAANCANCHGTNGQAANGGGMPALAGLSAAYISEQMLAFKTGKRQGTIMHQLAKGYSDAEITQMAAYFAAQKPSK